MSISKVIAACAAATISLAGVSAQAQTAPSTPAKESGISTYVGGGYSLYSGGDVRFSAATVRGGINFTPNIGVEAEFSKGIGEGDIKNSGFSSAKLGLDTQFSGFAIGRLPLSDQSNLFARLGYSTATLDVTVPQLSRTAVSVELKDVIWGIGGEYYFNDRFGVRGEVTGFKAEGDNVDDGLDIFSISLVAKF